MKIVAYEVKNYEIHNFEKISKELNVDIILEEEVLTLDNVNLAEGCQGIIVLGQGKVDNLVIDKINEYEIKYLATRSIGFDHIDVKYANSKGIKVSKGYYEPNGVAEYTVMLMLMCIRHYKQAMFRGNVNDYSLEGLQGKEMKDLTVGVIGTGKIGATVVENLQGFGCKVIAYDKYINSKLDGKVTYVDLDTLYKESDIVTLHTPLLEETRYMINEESINKMKDEVVIVNCSRGELINTEDLIKAVEIKKVGAVGLDVIEGEKGIYHLDRCTDILANRNMAYLRQFPNVVMTQHMAFYTDVAVESMVNCAVRSIDSFIKKGTSELEIKL